MSNLVFALTDRNVHPTVRQRISPFILCFPSRSSRAVSRNPPRFLAGHEHHDRTVVIRVLRSCPIPGFFGRLGDKRLLVGYRYVSSPGLRQIAPVGLQPLQIAPMSLVLLAMPRNRPGIGYVDHRDL
jgi:hypothetical protein